MVYSELPEISFGWWAFGRWRSSWSHAVVRETRADLDISSLEVVAVSRLSRKWGGGGGDAFHSRYLKCPLWEAGDTMWSRNECWRTNIPKRKQRR